MSLEDLFTLDNLSVPDIVHVPIEMILLDSTDGRPVYTTREEASQNPMDLAPSPEVLARHIVKSKTAKPIQLVRYDDPAGRYQYRFDSYDFLGQLRRYWAWIIAYGEETRIPARIVM